ncbi:MAG: hypothetical protein VXW43_17475, partial [Pseudomonadota bacterium]|nr:hypothetical protein [Pseudomonadota bacterium]
LVMGGLALGWLLNARHGLSAHLQRLGLATGLAALLAKLAARNELTGLSMGMSGDFEQAIALGATHVRVGSAIFGARS